MRASRPFWRGAEVVMPYEFEDLSKDVAKGTEDVKKGLDSITRAAENADKASAKLSNTQRSALEISDKFAASLEKSAKSMSMVGRAGKSASKAIGIADGSLRSAASSMMSVGAGAKIAAAGFRNVSAAAGLFAQAEKDVAGVVKEVEGLGAKLKEIKSQDVSLNVNLGGAEELEDLISLTEKLRKLELKEGKQNEKIAKKEEKVYKREEKADIREIKRLKLKPKLHLKAQPKESKPIKWETDDTEPMAPGNWSKDFIKQSKEIEHQLDVLRDDIDDVTSQKNVIELSLKAKTLDLINDFKSSLSEADQKAMAVQIRLGKVEEVAEQIASINPVFALKLEKTTRIATTAVKELTSVEKTLNDELMKQSKTVGDLIKKSFLEGKKEAMSFAGGLGSSATGMMAVGVAAYFLSQKAGEMAKAFQASAVSLGSFSNQAALAGKIIMGSAPSLDNMRKSLSLTREQSVEFFETVREGVNQLGMSRDAIMETATAFQDAFGGDPTKRLKQYIDLLREIPTLETDLKIGAEMDDQSAALFALAKEGKIDMVMEMQTAGLLGGEAEELPGKEILKSNQKSEYYTQAIGDALLNKIYPTWGPYLSATADGMSKVVSGVAAFAVGLGGLSLFLQGSSAAALTATNVNTAVTAEGDAAIVTALVGMSGKDVAGKLIGNASRVPEKMGFGKQLASVGRNFVGSVKTAGQSLLKFAKTTGGVAGILGAIFIGVGMVMRGFAAQAERAGDMVGAAKIDIGASIADTIGKAGVGAAVGAAIGTVLLPIPGLGTALGALAGLAWGVISNWDNIGKDFDILGVAATDVGKAFYDLQKAEVTFMKKDSFRQKELMKSAQLLQEAFARNKNAVDNAKLALFDFERKVAEVDLESMSSRGGSAQGYAQAMTEMISNVNKRFDVISKNVSDRFDDIMSKEDMLPEQRKQALDDLHMMEMESVKVFVDGVKTSVENLYKTPKAIKEKKEGEIIGGRLERATGAGVVGEDVDKMLEDLGKNVDNSIASVVSGYDKSTEASEAMAKKLADAAKAAKDKVGKTYGEISKIGENNAEDIKKAEEDIAKKRIELAEHKKLEQSMSIGPTGASMAVSTAGSEKAASELAEAEERLRKARAESGVPALIGKFGKLPATMDDAAAASAVVSKSIEDLRKTAEETEKKMPHNLFRKAGSVAKMKKESTMTAAEEAITDVEKKHAIKKIKEEKAPEAEKASAEFEKEFKESLKASGGNQKDIDSLYKKVTAAAEASANAGGDAGDAMIKILQNMEGFTDVEKKILTTSFANYDANLAVLKSTNASLGAAQMYSAALREMMTATDGSIAELELIEIGSEKWAENMEKIKRFGGQVLGAIDAVEVNAQKELAVLDKKAAIAKKTGNAAKQVAELQTRETKMNVDSYAAAKKAVPIMKQRQDELMKQVEIKKKELEAQKGKGVGKAVTDKTEAAIVELNSAVAMMGVSIGEAEGKMGQSVNNMKTDMEVFDDVIQKAGTSVDMLSAALDKDLSDAFAEAAPYSKDLGKYAEESFELAVKAAKKKAAFDKETLASGIAAIKENAKEQARMLREQGGSEEDVKKIIGRGDETAASKERLGNAKIEAELGKSNVESAKRSMELKLSELDLSKGMVDAAMDIAEVFDGSAGAIRPLLEEQLNIEKAKLREMKKTAAKAKELNGNTLETRKLELEVVKKEAEIQKKGLDNAMKVIDLRKKEVDVVSDVLQAEMDYLIEVGGSFGRMADLQGEILGMERMKVQLAKDALQAAKDEGVEGLALMEKQAEVRKAELGYQRKAMGAQKSMLDKFIGAAFGGLSDVGARRGMGSDRALLGTAATRVVSPSGLMSGTGGGSAGTIEERAAKAQFSAASGKVGGGLMSGKGPKKAKIEEDIQKNTKATADDIGTIKKEATTKGSLYTSDADSQSILSRMLSVLNDISAALTGGAKVAGSTTMAANPSATNPLVDLYNEGMDVEKKKMLLAKDNLAAAEQAGMMGVELAEMQAKAKKAELGYQKKLDSTSSGGAERTGAGVADKEGSANTLEDQLKVARKNFKVAKDEYLLAKKENRLTKEIEASVAESGAKVTELESGVRVKENKNPYAGAAAGIEDYSRVMAGKAMPEIEQFAKDAEKVAKYGDVGKKAYEKQMNQVKGNAEKAGKMVDDEADKRKQELAKAPGGYTASDYSEKYDKIEKDRVAAHAKIADYQEKGAAGAAVASDRAMTEAKAADDKKVSMAKKAKAGGKSGMGGSRLGGGKFGGAHLGGGKFDPDAKTLQGGKFSGMKGLGGGKFSGMKGLGGGKFGSGEKSTSTASPKAMGKEMGKSMSKSGGSKIMGKEMGKSMSKSGGSKELGKSMGEAMEKGKAGGDKGTVGRSMSKMGGVKELGKPVGETTEAGKAGGDKGVVGKSSGGKKAGGDSQEIAGKKSGTGETQGTPVPKAVGAGTSKAGQTPVKKGASTPMAPVGGAGASSAATTESVTVKGEIKVTFDSKLFRTEMTTLVAEVMKTPQIRQALSNQGFVTVNP